MSEFMYEPAVGFAADDVNSPNSHFIFGNDSIQNAFGLSHNSFTHGLPTYDSYNGGFLPSDVDDNQFYYGNALSRADEFNEFGKRPASCDLSNSIKKRMMNPKLSTTCPPMDLLDGSLSSPVTIPFSLVNTPPLGSDMMYFGNSDNGAQSPIFTTPLHMFSDFHNTQVSPPDSPQDFPSPTSNEEIEENRTLFCVTPEQKFPEMDSTEVSDNEGSPRSRAKADSDAARDHELYKEAAPSSDDGMYHCPWEGTNDCNHKPEKLKCNYDKYVDSHLRPYRCKMPSCEATRFSSTACLLRHEREAHRMHGHRALHCLYPGCERSVEGKGFPRAWNLRDHMRRVHNDNSYPAEIIAETHKPKARRASKESAPRSRKSSKSVAAAAAAAAEAMSRLQDEEWAKDFTELEELVHLLNNRRDPKNGENIKVMQKKLEKMSSQLQVSIASSIKPANSRRSSAGNSE